MKNKHKKNIIILSILILMYIFCGMFYLDKKQSTKDIDKDFQKDLIETYNNIENSGEKFVFKKDSLVYWQTNTIPLDSNIFLNKKIIQLKNGFYIKKNNQSKDSTTVFLYLIKTNYTVTNKYIDNSFNEPFSLNKNINICFNKTKYPIKINNEVVCYLNTSHYDFHLSKNDFFVCHLFFAITLFFTFVFLISLIKKKKLRPIISIPLIVFIYILYFILVIILCNRFGNILFTINQYNFIFFVIVVGIGFLVYLLTMKLMNIEKTNRYFLSKKLLIILCISIICGSIIEVFSYKKIEQKIEIKANALLKQRNILLEQRFSKLSLCFNNDKQLQEKIKEKDNQKIEKYITNKYFSTLKDAYHIGVLAFNDNEIMVVQPNNYMTKTLDYVENRLKNVSSFCNDSCCFMENSEIDDSKTYIYFSKISNKNIFIECLKKKESKNMNYSLLLSSDNDENLDNMSYAKYYNNNLVYSYGERNFNLNKTKQINGLVKEKAYDSYYANNAKEKTTWVVSSKNDFIYNIISVISLFFFVLTIMMSIEYIVNNLPNIFSISFTIKSSILLSLIGAFIVSSFLLGFFGIRSIKDINNKNNINTLKEKTQSVQLELEKDLYGKDDINKLSNPSLISLSNAFLTDINLFDTSGVLISSSQKTIFDKGLSYAICR
jgi:hypothetical protein